MKILDNTFLLVTWPETVTFSKSHSVFSEGELTSDGFVCVFVGNLAKPAVIEGNSRQFSLESINIFLICSRKSAVSKGGM